jgi:hypothetical protein
VSYPIQRLIRVLTRRIWLEPPDPVNA